MEQCNKNTGTAGGEITCAGGDVTSAGEDVTSAGGDVTSVGDDVTSDLNAVEELNGDLTDSNEIRFTVLRVETPVRYWVRLQVLHLI